MYYFPLPPDPQVVAGSGRGWRMFRLRPKADGAAAGELSAVVPLDYENPQHRQGFLFRVQVTDMVRRLIRMLPECFHHYLLTLDAWPGFWRGILYLFPARNKSA